MLVRTCTLIVHVDTHNHTDAHTKAAISVGKGGTGMRLYYTCCSTLVFLDSTLYREGITLL